MGRGARDAGICGKIGASYIRSVASVAVNRLALASKTLHRITCLQTLNGGSYASELSDGSGPTQVDRTVDSDRNFNLVGLIFAAWEWGDGELLPAGPQGGFYREGKLRLVQAETGEVLLDWIDFDAEPGMIDFIEEPIVVPAGSTIRAEFDVPAERLCGCTFFLDNGSEV